MPKFGWCRFAEDKFGNHVYYHNLKFRMFGTVPLGIDIRRTIGKSAGDTSRAVTFRVRRGNGYYGSVAGKIYQDKYPYPNVTGLENNIPNACKVTFAAAVAAWQGLSPTEKTTWRTRGTRIRPILPGYNLFIRKHIKGA